MIEITSEAFKEGGTIPRAYTCDGEDKSPPLRWSSVPEGTGSLALVADDPDAPGGTWVHWVLWGLPADTKELPDGSRQGTTDFKRVGYGGPCPPLGHGAHHYYFKLYALDNQPALGAGSTKKDLLSSMEGRILAEGQLIGTYERN